MHIWGDRKCTPEATGSAHFERRRPEVHTLGEVTGSALLGGPEVHTWGDRKCTHVGGLEVPLKGDRTGTLGVLSLNGNSTRIF